MTSNVIALVSVYICWLTEIFTKLVYPKIIGCIKPPMALFQYTYCPLMYRKSYLRKRRRIDLLIFIIRIEKLSLKWDCTSKQRKWLHELLVLKNLNTHIIAFTIWMKIFPYRINNSRVSRQKGPTRHAYAWQIGPFWQDTLKVYYHIQQLFKLYTLYALFHYTWRTP